MLAPVEVAVAVPDMVMVVGVIETIVVPAGMPEPVRAIPGVRPAVLLTVKRAELALEVTASNSTGASATVQVWSTAATSGAEMVTDPLAPAVMLMPSEPLIVRELEDTAPGAMEMVREVFAAVALGRNSREPTVNPCSRVVASGAPPVMLSAWKITF
jgi:hypothetical protein